MSNERKGVLTERLVKIFDTKIVASEETKSFKHVYHKKLCEAFEYWVDQTKLLFGEAVWIEQTQSLRDSGVDLAINIPKSGVKYGIQVKSHGDIENKHFSKNVLAQITQTKKHGLERLFLALAADLTDGSQLEKARGLAAELNQQKDDYVILIPPEKVLPIYKAFKGEEHPLKSVHLDFQDAAILSNAISESLSNENRSVKVEVSFEYKNLDPKNYPVQAKIAFELKEDEISLMDAINRAHATGETVKISAEKIKKVQVYEHGKPLLSDNFQGDLIITPEKTKFTANLQAAAANKIIKSLDGLVFVVSNAGNQQRFSLEDEEEPFRVEILLDPKGSATFSAAIEHWRSDVVRLMRAIEFHQSLRNADALKIADPNSDRADSIPISKDTVPEIEPVYIEFAQALAAIQKKTGERLELPKKLDELTVEQVNDVFSVAENIQAGRIPTKGMKFEIKVHRVKFLELLEKFKNDGKLEPLVLRQKVIADVLKKKIIIGPTTVKLTGLRPTKDANELYNELVNSILDQVVVELQTDETADILLDWFQSKTKSPEE